MCAYIYTRYARAGDFPAKGATPRAGAWLRVPTGACARVRARACAAGACLGARARLACRACHYEVKTIFRCYQIFLVICSGMFYSSPIVKTGPRNASPPRRLSKAKAGTDMSGKQCPRMESPSMGRGMTKPRKGQGSSDPHSIPRIRAPAKIETASRFFRGKARGTMHPRTQCRPCQIIQSPSVPQSVESDWV